MLFLFLGLIFGLYAVANFNTSPILTKRNNDFYLLIIFSVAILLAGFRGPMVGADTMAYHGIFYRINQYTSLELIERKLSNSERIEFGYLIINKLIGTFSENSQFLLLLASTLTLIPIYKYIKFINLDIFLPVLLFFSLGTYFSTFNLVRQQIAGSIHLLIWMNLLKGEKRKAIFYYLISILFHSTGVVGIVLFYIHSMKKNKKSLLFHIAIIGLCSLFVMPFMEVFVAFFPKYRYAISYDNYKITIGGITLLWFFMIFSIIVLLLNINFRKMDDFEKNNLFLSVISNVIYLSLSFVALNFTLAGRISHYFVNFTIYHLCYTTKLLKNNHRIYVFLLSIILTALYLVKASGENYTMSLSYLT